MEVNSTLRLPGKVDERLKAEARAARRSKNQQIVHILEERYNLITNVRKQDEVKVETRAA